MPARVKPHPKKIAKAEAKPKPEFFKVRQGMHDALCIKHGYTVDRLNSIDEKKLREAIKTHSPELWLLVKLHGGVQPVVKRIQREHALGLHPDANTTVTENEGFVKTIVSKLVSRQSPHFEDALNEGRLGLFKAYHRFNPDYGNRFTTYAGKWVYKGALAAIYGENGVPKSISSDAFKVDKAKTALQSKLGRLPAISELADHTKFSEEKVSLCLGAMQLIKKSSLDAEIDSGKGGRNRTLGEGISDPKTAHEHVGANIISPAVLQAIEKLPELERKVVHLHFFERKSPREINEELRGQLKGKSSREMYRQAMRRLKINLREWHSQQE